MSSEKTKKTSSRVMELKDLISAPLIATIDADSTSSRHYLKYLYEIAFEDYDTKTAKASKLRMLCFSYMSCENGLKKLQSVSVPLLTLVPLPLLQVKEACFDFDIQVIDGFEQVKENSFSLKDGSETAYENSSEGMKLRVSLASMSGESNKESMVANMKIKVRMEQADMPGGLMNLLNLTANNLTISEHDDK